MQYDFRNRPHKKLIYENIRKTVGLNDQDYTVRSTSILYEYCFSSGCL